MCDWAGLPLLRLWCAVALNAVEWFPFSIKKMSCSKFSSVSLHKSPIQFPRYHVYFLLSSLLFFSFFFFSIINLFPTLRMEHCCTFWTSMVTKQLTLEIQQYFFWWMLSDYFWLAMLVKILCIFKFLHSIEEQKTKMEVIKRLTEFIFQFLAFCLVLLSLQSHLAYSASSF